MEGEGSERDGGRGEEENKCVVRRKTKRARVGEVRVVSSTSYSIISLMQSFYEDINILSSLTPK